MTCPDPDELADLLVGSMEVGCDVFSRLLHESIPECRTPTKGTIPRYFLISLGDSMGRRAGEEDLDRIVECWCEVGDEERTALAVMLGRLAMVCPDEVSRSIRALKCSGRALLARWVYPVLGIWSRDHLDSLEDRGLFLLSWAWYARYVPEDAGFALERIMSRADVVDRYLVMALKELRRVSPSMVLERLRDRPGLLRRVIPSGGGPRRG